MAAVEFLDGPANLGAPLSAEHAAAPLSPVGVHARHFARDGRGVGTETVRGAKVPAGLRESCDIRRYGCRAPVDRHHALASVTGGFRGVNEHSLRPELQVPTGATVSPGGIVVLGPADDPCGARGHCAVSAFHGITPEGGVD